MNLFKWSLTALFIAGASSSSLNWLDCKTNNQLKTIKINNQKHSMDGNVSTDILVITQFDNNKALFINGKTKEEYFDVGTFKPPTFQQATLSFILTSQGTASLMYDYVNGISSWTTGRIIMAWLDHNLRYFDNLHWNSYLNNIESGAKLNKTFYVASDSDAYSDFEDNLGQPSAIVHKLVDAFKQKLSMPEVAIKFHFSYHLILKDSFSVNFITMVPYMRILW